METHTTDSQKKAVCTSLEDPFAWVDDLNDEEFGDVTGPSWYALTGRRTDHLVPGPTPSVLLKWMRSALISSMSALLSVIRRRHPVTEDGD